MAQEAKPAQQAIPQSIPAGQLRALSPHIEGAPVRYRRLVRAIAATDILCLGVVMVAAYLIRFGSTPIPWDFVAVMVAAPFVWVALASAFRLYAVQNLTGADEFRRILSAVGIWVAAIAIVTFWSKSS